MFKNREDAGQQLAQALKKYSLKKDESIILALPRGGVVVGAEISKILNLPVDIIVTRKIGHPFNPEYAIAAVGEHAEVLSSHEKIDKNYLKIESQKERQEIQRRIKLYRGEWPNLNLKNKNIILVDDGLATGLTMEAAINEVKYFNPKKIIIAVPVAPPDTLNNLKKETPDIVILELEPNFYAVGQFYQDFSEVEDREVIRLLSGDVNSQ